jgi:hypothetical protein
VAFRGSSLAPWLHPPTGASALRRAVWAGGIVPAAAFVVAECAERIAAGVAIAPDLSLIALGVLVEFAIGVLAWLVVRHCIRLVDSAIAWLRAPRLQRSSLTPSITPRTVDGPPARGVMARAWAGRAPPQRLEPDR